MGKPIPGTVAGLTVSEGLRLLKEITGIDPGQAFDAARNRLVATVTVFNKLPPWVGDALYKVLDAVKDPKSQAFTDLTTSLQRLADPDPTIRKAELSGSSRSIQVSNTPAGKILISACDGVLLAALENTSLVQDVAAGVLTLLKSDTFLQLAWWLGQALDLSKLTGAQAVAQLDQFLVDRLGAFLDRALTNADLKPIQTTLAAVLDKGSEIYSAATKALTADYSANVALAWGRS